METIPQYLQIMSLTLLFLFMIQGCSFYMGFQVKSAPQSENKTAHSGTLNERGTVETAFNQDPGREK
jgi:hypothetical protein